MPVHVHGCTDLCCPRSTPPEVCLLLRHRLPWEMGNRIVRKRHVEEISGSEAVLVIDCARCVVSDQSASQRSLHNAPIFRLLLKVAVNGAHQCDFLIFAGRKPKRQHPKNQPYLDKA